MKRKNFKLVSLTTLILFATFLVLTPVTMADGPVPVKTQKTDSTANSSPAAGGTAGSGAIAALGPVVIALIMSGVVITGAAIASSNSGDGVTTPAHH